MKPTKEIIGLRIISISDGTQVGVVKDIVINSQGKSLDFFIIDQTADYFGAKVIAFADILGLGEFAITIPHLNVIQDVAQNVNAHNLLKQDIHVLGTKVLTKKGQLIGEVTEVLIDEETGQIAACIFESNGQTKQVQVEQIITLGKELLIVETEHSNQNHQRMIYSSDDQPLMSDATPNVIDQTDIPAIEQTNTNIPEIEPADIPVINPIEELSKTDLDYPKEVEPAENSFNNKTNFVEEIDFPEEKETGFNLFEQRQLQYFIGKRVEKDIVLDNAEILRAGERITPDIVTHITTRSTLMEVTSHLQKN